MGEGLEAEKKKEGYLGERREDQRGGRLARGGEGQLEGGLETKGDAPHSDNFFLNLRLQTFNEAFDENSDGSI